MKVVDIKRTTLRFVWPEIETSPSQSSRVVYTYFASPVLHFSLKMAKCFLKIKKYNLGEDGKKSV